MYIPAALIAWLISPEWDLNESTVNDFFASYLTQIDFVQGGVVNSSIAPIGIARRMILAVVTSREIYPGNFKWFHRAKLFRGFKW